MASRPQNWKHEPQSVRGKRILVTGATAGIGRATALLLASEGADIAFYGRSDEKLQDALRDIQAAAKGKVHGFTADQSQRSEVQRIFATVDRELGGLDILINNVGVAAEDVEAMDDEKIEYVVRTNLVGYLLCAKHAMERMGNNDGGGHIVNVGSLSAEVRETESGVYVATKAGIQGWCEAMRKTFNEGGIKVSLLELGSVGTDMQSGKDQPKKEAAGKMLTAEDVAEAVLYCLTQPARCDVINVRLRPHLQAI